MFQQIRQRLLWSYLLVLATILVVFALAVRTVFTRSLYHQLIDELVALGQGAATAVEYENGVLKPDDDVSIKSLTEREQSLQWFDLKGQLIAQRGETVLTLPLDVNQTVQIETNNQRILGVILPTIDSDTNQTVGYVRANESLVALDATLRKLDLGLGGGIGIALLLSGISGIWLARQAMQPIEQSFHKLQQFTADASHELRSPLMVIKSNVAVALKYPDGMRETDIEKFEAIASATSQMTHLTEDLLFLARTEQMPQRHKEVLDLTLLLTNLVNLYQPQANSESIQLKQRLQPNLSVAGDVTQLTRIFTNLLDNALCYTPNGGLIELTAKQVRAVIEVSVQDTGVGIAPEQLEHVFDRFWRADQSRSYWDGGSGLGLSIAQSIAQHHGGKISVTSQIETGSCFTVRLPALS